MRTSGFIGIGNMGLPMAQKLIDAGHPLLVHDLREAALEPLLRRQARRAASPREIADECEVVFTSLLTIESLKAVMLGADGLIHGQAIKIVVNTSTVGISVVEELAAAMSQRGIGLVDCPISGGPPGARDGSLSVMISGARHQVDVIKPLVAHWGVVTVAGDKPGMAQLLKLTNNILSAVAMAATAEAFVMGAKGGLDPEVMMAAINAGSGRNSMTLQKIPLSVLDRSFNYGGPMHTLMKDVELAIAQGEALGVPMEVCQAARLAFKHAMSASGKDQDVTEIVKFVEQRADFQIPKTR